MDYILTLSLTLTIHKTLRYCQVSLRMPNYNFLSLRQDVSPVSATGPCDVLVYHVIIMSNCQT